MGYPRSHLIHADEAGFYHLVSRCVRRAWLCGFDRTTQRDYNHRRSMIYHRLQLLCQIFAIDVWAYAIMSNHYHLVIRTAPQRPHEWTRAEVARRWIRLTRPTESQAHQRAMAQLLEQDQLRIEELRKRLGSVSWFMRFLNESIARRANQEDNCTGRFWEGRFKSQALLDESAVLMAMVYNDLNPFRTAATDPDPAAITSLEKRSTTEQTVMSDNNLPIQPIFSDRSEPSSAIPISETDYLNLVSFSRSSDPQKAQAFNLEFLEKLGGVQQSLELLAQMRKQGRRAIGRRESLIAYAERIGQRWLHGTGRKAPV